ncbi:MAG: type II CRISPR RNA-guided endonuclease Cas9 [Kiloniellales bacterium]
MSWRLGVDLGTNSLGWWAFEVEKEGDRWRVRRSLDGGVYIFSDGREPAKGGRVGDSRAVARRMARGARRNRSRRKARLRAFVRDLIQLGLLPASDAQRRTLFQSPKGASDPLQYNPYRLRSEALNRALSPHELGRAVLHLGLRRGFKSNRLEESDEDGGKLREKMKELNDRLSGGTLGQFLWQRYAAELQREKSKPGTQAAAIRFRGEDELYPERAMYAAEFDAIRAVQQPYHCLDDGDWVRLRDRYVLFQWPLKPVERGACSFFPAHPRHWKDTPIGHDFRLYQELNSLRWIDGDRGEHNLNAEQRAAVLDLLMTRKSEVKFKSLRAAKRSGGGLLFDGCHGFNLDDGKRKGLKPHRFAVALSANESLAPLWEARQSDQGDAGRLDGIFEALLTEPEESALLDCLTGDFDLSPQAARALASLRLSRATASVSRRFMEQIVPILRDQGLLYWDAVAEMRDADGQPLHHSHRPGSGDRDLLPYYGEVLPGMLGGDATADPQADPEQRFGRIGNPTVHVALNALRRVVNSLIVRFGSPPVEIHVELARELKQAREQRNEQTRRQAQQARDNERIRKMLRGNSIAIPSARDVKKVKLWEELGPNALARLCPFSGRPISFAQLMNGEAEIEHILPVRRTLDDSMSNLTVAFRHANRLKGNNSPHEAFGQNFFAAEGILWEGVRERAAHLPKSKAWRFGPDAMERFARDSDFIARQLTDTAYTSRSATRYLGCLKGVEQIVPNRGQLTALLRGKWRLNGILADDNRKSREDHRHHAVDAAVIALADRALLAAVSRDSGRGADERLHILVPELPERIEQAIRERVPEIVVAYKPDHGATGAMYKETAYGLVRAEAHDPDLPEHGLVTRRKITDLTRKEAEAVRDDRLRRALVSCLDRAAREGVAPAKALADFGKDKGIKRLRILVKDQTVEPVGSASYKGYKADSYVCCDVWRCPKGRAGNWRPGQYEWQGVFWTYAETANGVPKASQRKPHPAAKLVARLFKDDLVAYEEAEMTRIMRVAGFSTTNNKLDMKPHNLSDSERNYVSINVLGRQGLRKLRCDPDGRVQGLSPGRRA